MNNEQFTGFEAVWDRVTADRENPAPVSTACGYGTDAREENRLARFMDAEAASEAAYRALSCRWRQNRCGAVFGRIAREEARHMSELQAAYYLLNGDSYGPKKPDMPETSLPEALRIMWLGENSAAAGYKAAAGDAENPAIADMYRDLADDESRHAMELFRLIKSFMM